MKSMTVDEFLKLGYLQEVNRRFLHPLGLALSVEVETDENGSMTAVAFGEIWDERDDLEGIVYRGSDLRPKAEAIDAEWARRQPPREARLGYMVQPVDQVGEALRRLRQAREELDEITRRLGRTDP